MKDGFIFSKIFKEFMLGWAMAIIFLTICITIGILLPL